MRLVWEVRSWQVSHHTVLWGFNETLVARIAIICKAIGLWLQNLNSKPSHRLSMLSLQILFIQNNDEISAGSCASVSSQAIENKLLPCDHVSLSHSTQTASARGHEQACVEIHFLPWQMNASQKSQTAPYNDKRVINRTLLTKTF